MDLLLAVITGAGLAAASGFRVFLPLVVASAAARAGWLQLSPDLAFLGSDAALIALTVASLVEIAAWYVPVLDHALDVAAGPVAVLSGAVLAASQLGELDPWVRLVASLVVGGGVAGSVHGLTMTARAASMAFTGGLGNPVVATGEALLAIVVAIMAVVVPVIGLLLVIVLMVGLVRRLRGRAAVV